MLHYPSFNPVAFNLGPIKVHWYGIMYLLSFAIGWGLAVFRANRVRGIWNSDFVTDLLFYVAMGVIIGGRVGYMILYDLPSLVANPLSLFAVWQGGMSFHGGFVGVLLAVALFCRKKKVGFFTVADFIAPIIPIGLAAGRLGNFINGELWGKVTNVPWAMVFPTGGPLPRHPSELYEFLLEGVVLFLLLWFFSAKPKPRMAVSAVFLIGYSCMRIFCEFFRVPDPQFGYVLWGWVTMGMVYSIPMLVWGVWLFWFAYHRDSGSEQTKTT